MTGFVGDRTHHRDSSAVFNRVKSWQSATVFVASGIVVEHVAQGANPEARQFFWRRRHKRQPRDFRVRREGRALKVRNFRFALWHRFGV